MKTKNLILILLLSINFISSILSTRGKVNTEQEEKDYLITNKFVSLYQELSKQNGEISKIKSSDSSDQSPDTFEIAIKLFGEYSLKGDHDAMNKILIWLKKEISVFKAMYCDNCGYFIKNENNKIKHSDAKFERPYFYFLNNFAISSAVPAILFIQKLKKSNQDCDLESQENLERLNIAIANYLKFLVENEADINHILNLDNWGSGNPELRNCKTSLLHITASTDQEWLITFLIKALKADTNCKDSLGRTPLHIALNCCKKELYIIEALLEHGADVNAEDSNKNKPLKLALEKGLIEIAVKLKDVGANLEKSKGQGFFEFFS